MISNADYGATLNNTNASSLLSDALDDVNTTVGTIATLTSINPGSSYNGDVVVSVVDPYVSGYSIPDGLGGFLGTDAEITGLVRLGVGLVSNVKIVASGLGYHTSGESITLVREANTEQTITGSVALTTAGVSEGYWEGTQGFLNSDKYIQDSFYYQEYSYEVRAKESLDKYSTILKKVMHPSGNELFGRVIITEFEGYTINTSLTLSQTLPDVISYLFSADFTTNTYLLDGISVAQSNAISIGNNMVLSANGDGLIYSTNVNAYSYATMTGELNAILATGAAYTLIVEYNL